MKVVKLEQNTEEWREFKLGKSGGSSLHALYPARTITREVAKEYLESQGIEVDKKLKAGEVVDMLTAEDIGRIKAEGDKKDGFYKLIAERIARPITPNDYEDRLEGRKFTMMERGHILEKEAVAEFEKRNKVKVDEKSVVWQRSDNPDSIVSPDAVIGDTRAVEVKAFDSHRIIRAYDENRYPTECHEQVVKYFIVNEKLEMLHVVMYTDVMPSLPYLQFDIKREDVADDIEELRAFEDAILKQVNALAAKLAF
jgi:hypothetical protein